MDIDWLHSLLSKFFKSQGFVEAIIRVFQEDLWPFHPTSFVRKARDPSIVEWMLTWKQRAGRIYAQGVVLLAAGKGRK